VAVNAQAGLLHWSGADAWATRMRLIKGEADPVVRNGLITSAYDDLSRETATLLGEVDANWLTFGKWASFTAGRFIRGEGAPVRWGAGKVAEGNVAIIADIAPQFVRFLELADADRDSGLAALVASDDVLGSNPTTLEAFTSYAEALAIDNDLDDPGSAQAMLRGNLLVAHHEQSLADDFVDDAMPLGGLFGVITTRFVTLEIPEGSLDLSDPVPLPRYLLGEQWPRALSEISDARLNALVRSYGHEWTAMDGSAATTWEVFDERMGYIAQFFRAYQRDPSLRAPMQGR
jgi:hypothetical protein